MKFLIIIILIFSFFKSIYYANFELKEKENKPAGIALYFLAILGFIFPTFLLFTIY